MSNIHSEDAQPNEFRTRRGGSAVPTIRTTHIPKNRRGSRGRSSGGYTQQTNRNSRNSYQDRAAWPSSSGSSSMHHGQNPSYPQFEYKRPAPESFGRTGGGNIPQKQPRLDSYQHSQVSGLPARPQASTSQQTSNQPPPPQTKGPQRINLEFPEFCQIGAHNALQLRLQWIQARKTRFEQEEYASVLSFLVMRNSVQFTYIKLRRPELRQQEGDSQANADTASFGSTSASIGVKVETEEASLPTSSVKSEQNCSDDQALLSRHTSASPKAGPSSLPDRTSLYATPPDVNIELQQPSRPFRVKREIDFAALLEQSRRLDRRRKVVPSLADAHTTGQDDILIKSEPSNSPRHSVASLYPAGPTLAEASLYNISVPDADTTSSALPTAEVTLELPGFPVLADDEVESDDELDETGRIPSDASDVDEVQDVVCIPRTLHDRPRRLLTDSSVGIFSLTMRGGMSLVSRAPPRKQQLLHASNDSSGETVEDACLLTSGSNTLLVIAKRSETAPVVVHSLEGHKIGEPSNLCRPRDQDRNLKNGVTAICSLPGSHSFVTGGFDHCIHLWTVSQDDISKSSWQPLSVKHSSTVQALLPLCDSSRKLLSGGADCTVNLWDLESERTVTSFKTSNSVFHAHAPTAPESCVLLEVAHRELQFELRDLRLGPAKAVCRFGYQTAKTHGRHSKGDVVSNRFASGGLDGVVRTWDLRNAEQPCSKTICFPGRRISQVAYDSGHLVVCSENHHLAFLDS